MTIKSATNMLMELRKTCQHPYLSDPSLERLDLSEEEQHKRLTDASGKLLFLKQLLPELKRRGHRVLLFSQFKIALDRIEDFLWGEGYKYLRLDGNVSQLKRQKDMDRFNNPKSEEFIYLLTTRAGGVGINLATADTVIIFDPDFNPHMDLQAISRSYRYGQEKRVLVFKLMTGIEEQIINKGKKKMVLDHLVVQQMGKETEEGEVDNLILYGVQEIRKEETSDAAAQKWTPQKIDDLIDGAEKEAEELAKREAEEDAAREAEGDKDGEEGDKKKKGGETMGFSFARVWETKDKGLVDAPDAEDEVELDDNMWAAFVEEREAEEARRRQASEAEAGRRRRAAKLAINYSLFDESPQKPKKGKNAKKGFKSSSVVDSEAEDSGVDAPPLDLPEDASDTDYVAPVGPTSDDDEEDDDQFDLLPDNTDDLSYELERHYAGIVSGKPHLTKAEKRALRQQRARELSLAPPPEAPAAGPSSSAAQPAVPPTPAQAAQQQQQQAQAAAYDAVVAEQFISRARKVLRMLYGELRIRERRDLQAFWNALTNVAVEKNQRFNVYATLAQQADAARDGSGGPNGRKRYTIRDTCLLVWEFIRSNAVLDQEGPIPPLGAGPQNIPPLSTDARLQLQIGARPPYNSQAPPQRPVAQFAPHVQQQQQRPFQYQPQQGGYTVRLQQPASQYAPRPPYPAPAHSLSAEQVQQQRAQQQAQQRYHEAQARQAQYQRDQQRQAELYVQQHQQGYQRPPPPPPHHQARPIPPLAHQPPHFYSNRPLPGRGPPVMAPAPAPAPAPTPAPAPAAAPARPKTPQPAAGRHDTPISVADSPQPSQASTSVTGGKQRISLSGEARPSGAQPTTPSALQLGDSSRFGPTAVNGAVEAGEAADSVCFWCGQAHALDECPGLLSKEQLEEMAAEIEAMEPSEDKDVGLTAIAKMRGAHARRDAKRKRRASAADDARRAKARYQGTSGCAICGQDVEHSAAHCPVVRAGPGSIRAALARFPPGDRFHDILTRLLTAQETGVDPSKVQNCVFCERVCGLTVRACAEKNGSRKLLKNKIRALEKESDGLARQEGALAAQKRRLTSDTSHAAQGELAGVSRQLAELQTKYEGVKLKLDMLYKAYIEWPK